MTSLIITIIMIINIPNISALLNYSFNDLALAQLLKSMIAKVLIIYFIVIIIIIANLFYLIIIIISYRLKLNFINSLKSTVKCLNIFHY